ncbi:Hypothetical predicted protein, partial [Marmota monax]
SQTSSSLEGRIRSVIRSPGSYVIIICEFREANKYIHWYQFKEGKSPRRILYYDIFNFKLDSGINSRKYEADK